MSRPRRRPLFTGGKKGKKGKGFGSTLSNQTSFFNFPSTFTFTFSSFLLFLNYISSSFRPRHVNIFLLLFLLICLARIGSLEASPNRYSAFNPRLKVKEREPMLTVGTILPFSTFQNRKFRNAIADGLKPFRNKLGKYTFNNKAVIRKDFRLDPSPQVILDTLCKDFLPFNVSAIIYLTRDESYGRHTASSQYFLQLAGYLGIPVIAWNADNSGLEQASHSGFLLQMAPSIHHQAAAMLSILVRYEWHAFTIVTSYVAGHTDFAQAVREQVNSFNDPADRTTANFKYLYMEQSTTCDEGSIITSLF